MHGIIITVALAFLSGCGVGFAVAATMAMRDFKKLSDRLKQEDCKCPSK